MRKVIIIAVLLCFALVAPALANDWTRINDEIDINTRNKIVRAYVLHEDYNETRDLAKEVIVNYIKTLTTGRERTNLGTLFNTRPALLGKVQHAVSLNIGKESSTRVPNGASVYYTFDLKLLKPIIPDINLP